MYSAQLKSRILPVASKTYVFQPFVPTEVYHAIAEKLGLYPQKLTNKNEDVVGGVFSWANNNETILLELGYGISFDESEWTKVQIALVANDFGIEL